MFVFFFKFFPVSNFPRYLFFKQALLLSFPKLFGRYSAVHVWQFGIHTSVSHVLYKVVRNKMNGLQDYDQLNSVRFDK